MLHQVWYYIYYAFHGSAHHATAMQQALIRRASISPSHLPFPFAYPSFVPSLNSSIKDFGRLEPPGRIINQTA